MPAPTIPIERAIVTAPAPAPMATWEVTAASVTLGLPELGAIRVSQAGIQILAPDEGAQDATWARLGLWASAQFYSASGFRVLPGCVIGRFGIGVAITGPARHGATLLGLQMTRHGWGIISDGLVILDESGRCRTTDSWATADSTPLGRLFPDYPTASFGSGRDRLRVSPPLHASAPLTAVVRMQVKQSLAALFVGDLTMSSTDPWSSLIGLESVLPNSIPAPVPPMVRHLSVRRPMPSTLAELEQVSPIAIAEQLARLLDGGPC